MSNLTPVQWQQFHKAVAAVKDCIESRIDFNIRRERQGLVNQLIYRNMQLMGPDTSPTFFYNGVMYSIGECDLRRRTVNGREYPVLNRVVHSDLLVEVDALLKASHEQDKFRLALSDYLRNVLLVSRHIDDVYALIGGDYLVDVSRATQGEMCIGSPMSYEQLEEFKKRNRDGAVALTRLSLENLLTG